MNGVQHMKCVTYCVSVQWMMSRLLVEGPATDGIFRLSANKKIVDAARRQLDSGAPLCVSELPMHAVAGLVKVSFIEFCHLPVPVVWHVPWTLVVHIGVSDIG